MKEKEQNMHIYALNRWIMHDLHHICNPNESMIG